MKARRRERYRASHRCRNCTWERAEEAVGSAATWGSRGRWGGQSEDPSGSRVPLESWRGLGIFLVSEKELSRHICVPWGTLDPFTSFTLGFHRTALAFYREYIMKMMCRFYHNITNDKLTQLGKDEAGTLTQECLDYNFVPFSSTHIAKDLQCRVSTQGDLFFPCLIHIYVGSRNKPKSKRNQD